MGSGAYGELKAVHPEHGPAFELRRPVKWEVNQQQQEDNLQLTAAVQPPFFFAALLLRTEAIERSSRHPPGALRH